MEYRFSKTINTSFKQAVEKVTEELKKEGFGIITGIDLKKTLKKKLILTSGIISLPEHVSHVMFMKLCRKKINLVYSFRAI